MTFHPNMDSRIDGVSLLEELKCRAWPGLIADVWTVDCESGANGHYVSRAPRLFFFLDGSPDLEIHLRLQPDDPEPFVMNRENPLCFIPAEIPVWSHITQAGRLCHLDLHLDLAALSDRFAGRLDRDVLQRPDFALSDQRLQQLARLIAEETTAPSGLDDIYGASLVTSLISVLAMIKPTVAADRGKLPPRHLRRVMDHMTENYARNITLKELADLVGLSPSYFSEAFKRSTGLPPHRWQMAKRVGEAKRMLEESQMSPTEVAIAAGFSDQAHFTRVFRRFEGTTPAAWRRAKS